MNLKGSITRESDFTLSQCVFLKKGKKLCSYEWAKLMQNRPLKSDAECHNSECHYAECYVECHGAKKISCE